MASYGRSVNGLKKRERTCEFTGGNIFSTEFASAVERVFQQGLRIEDLLPIFGILLRNLILEERGIPIADIDKHEPKIENGSN